MKKKLALTLCCILLIFPLAACGGALKVETEPLDPKLKGQVIHFTVPVVYMKFNDDDKSSFDKKTINVGQLLTSEATANSLYNHDNSHIVLEVKKDMSFSIVESYWARHDWFTREFAPDRHMIVLKDENGEYSACIKEFLGYSDKKWLTE
jgi:hypothetical protein